MFYLITYKGKVTYIVLYYLQGRNWKQKSEGFQGILVWYFTNFVGF